MFGFICRRLASAIPLIFIVLTLSFFLIRSAPGSPFDKEVELPPEIKANLAAQYGMDKPVPEQYLNFMINAAQGEFGYSYMYQNRRVSEIIGESFLVSAKLGGISMIVAMIIGTLLGVLSSLKQNSWLDHLTMTSVILGKSVPPMVVAPFFVFIFAITLHWLPVAGWNEGAFLNLIGPVICLALYDIAIIARLTRASMLETARQKYIVTARAKGLRESRVVFVHTLREAILPLITYLGPALASILLGTVVVEQVFNIPGLGRYLVSAANNRDYTLILGIATLTCVLVIFFNALADVLRALVDPRVRLK